MHHTFLGTTNVPAVTQLLNTSELEHRNIFMIYDIHHLLKNIQNTLHQCDILFEQNTFARWFCIEEAKLIKLDVIKVFIFTI